MSSNTKSILFPTDLSEAAQDAWGVAVLMAKAYEANIILLHVIEPPSGVIKLLAEYEDEIALRKARKILDEFIESHPVEGLSMSRMVKIGKPHRKIVEACWELDPELLVMSTHGASGIKEVLVGSNASRVIRSAPCPVISVRDQINEPLISNVLLPIDLTKESREKIARSIKLAKIFSATLHLVSVLPEGKRENEIHQELKGKLEKSAQQIRNKGVNVEASVAISSSGVGKTLLKYAETNNIDLLCIMTQQEFNIKELFLGSNAAHIVNRSKKPVMSIRPKQYFPMKKPGSVLQ